MSQSKFLVVGNWKANKNLQEIDHWTSSTQKIEKLLKENGDWLTVAIAPPLVYLDRFRAKTTGGLIQMAAQNISIFSNGAYTGEVTGKMVVDFETKYVFIGHSERRKLLHESPVEVEKKIDQAISEGIIPIIGCQNFEEIPTTIRNYRPDQYVIMYEPFEAISSEAGFHPVTPEKINQVISDWVTKLNIKMTFVYGGSVTTETVTDISKISALQGLVVGRESLEAEKFSSIIESIVKSRV